MDKSLRRGVALLLLGLAVAGCTNGIGTGSEIEPGPVGVGPAIDELKGTPCACMEIPMTIPGSMQV